MDENIKVQCNIVVECARLEITRDRYVNIWCNKRVLKVSLSFKGILVEFWTLWRPRNCYLIMLA